MTKYPLVLLPTPQHRLNNLSEFLGIDLWIKRDDLTGFAGGGNKGRKLEYLMAEALMTGATAVVSCGADQSNFVRQLGAACAVAGLKCSVVTMRSPYETLDRQVVGVLSQGGNIDLDHWFGIDRRRVGDGTWSDLESAADERQRELEHQGEVVFRIPLGGSSPISVHAFVEAGQEIEGNFDWVITSSSSGSTQVGLAHHFAEAPTRVLGISADPEPEIVDDLLDLSARYADWAGVRALTADQIQFNLEFVGAGYGVGSSSSDRGIGMMARAEGILLDPIYSGKAFGGLVDLVHRGDVRGRVLFWHTGGTPALFARSESPGG
jgi:1-aminocyclopropane-1-carboxylate deaminase/D-cysteine desulfhydrase-like pyridoxal-dependent ACC family enzyme